MPCRARQTADEGVSLAITHIEEGRLSYRGHDVLALAREQVPFESVAELLWTGTLPTASPAWTAPSAVVDGARRIVADPPEGSL